MIPVRENNNLKTSATLEILQLQFYPTNHIFVGITADKKGQCSAGFAMIATAGT